MEVPQEVSYELGFCEGCSVPHRGWGRGLSLAVSVKGLKGSL